MTFETMMLRGLFGACVLVCGLLLVEMVGIKPAPAQWAGEGASAAAVASVVATSTHPAG
jgi:hypothetical protein